MRGIDASAFVAREQDQHLIDIAVREVMHEKALPTDELATELSEELRDRFQLEGCVVDDEKEILYYGMENLGVWKLHLGGNDPARLIAKV